MIGYVAIGLHLTAAVIVFAIALKMIAGTRGESNR